MEEATNERCERVDGEGRMKEARTKILEGGERRGKSMTGEKIKVIEEDTSATEDNMQ
jgi:hypothetical protein